ncbi:MAG: putative selenate ABC transporter substrate-binding protein [Rhodospirillaceae bacterium]|nr:putative selenate ABC transporter substrate-binding protein [Rhodospirillaceae bacterium]MBT7769399.1 putative selenate ABC transporter substrate-binding protein [Rhodospirillales bacterium]MBT4700835.1 putative selenate ABC transporter substrate-binding protein [Rhodospirillaceae bacterium]MBT5034559.1 putative selenate ABC transporter substrate-binding protein [Rhodospirillaceae bacterium]MBT6221210.1 putative selenate ABC transporter substrate-binding protein [Rhodospirillaceae bacterium]
MVLIMALVAPVLGVGSAKAADTFVFTAIPDEDQAQLRKRFNKVADYLSNKLGVKTKYIPVKSYGAAVTAFRNNQVQLAWFGGLSGVRARTLVKGSQAIAQGAEDKAFVTYFIAHASTGMKESKTFPKAMAGKTFTFGSKGSTSGRLMPDFHIRKIYGKAPKEVFTKVGFSGNHTKTIQLVQSGAYQVGAVNFKVWEKNLKSGKVDPKKVSIIWRTPPYPDYQWSVRGDIEKKFGTGFIGKITNVLLNMKDKDLLASFPRSGFIPAKNADYQPILDVGKKINLID